MKHATASPYTGTLPDVETLEMDEDERASTDPSGSEVDAEGEEVDEEFELQIAHGMMSRGNEKPASDSDEEEEVDADGEVVDEEEEEGSSRDSDASDTDTSSEENEWQAESDAEAEKTADSNLCIFCGQDEENDPSEEYEEYLECVGCHKNSHRQCARDADELDPKRENEKWRCKTCVEAGIGEEEEEDATSVSSVDEPSEPKASAPGLFSSVFQSLWDKSRSLRKRKSSEAESTRPMRKRRLTGDASAGADKSTSDVSDDSSAVRPARPRRPRKADKPLVHIVNSEGVSLIVSINVDPIRVQKILSKKPRKKYKERSKKKFQMAQIDEPEPPHYPALPTSYNPGFLPLFERDGDESKSKPYGGILSEADADTSKTFPLTEDRKRFEEARERAEEDWKRKMAATNNVPEPTKPSQKMSGPPSKIKCINFGGFEIDTWNAAPYPEEYSRNKILYICEFCLKYMNSDFVAWRHKLKCPEQHPPGDEIYRDGRYSFFEVDGRKNPVYCQNLCLLAKLFLGSKTLYYDVEPFLFYVMTENDELGCHFVGYFSKEKRPSSMNNVSCILVLPIYQRRGFGQMLIDFSYQLTRREKKTGSPEKPLSDMGLVSYRQYWRLMMCYELLNQKEALSIMELTKRTGMTPDDVVSALEGLRALVRDPVTKQYALRLDHDYYREYIQKYESKGYPTINPEALVWVPYVMNRGLSQHYEGNGPMHTVAPREEDEEDDEAVEDDSEEAEEAEDVKEVIMANGDDHSKVNGTNGADSAAESGPSTPLPNGDANQLLLLASGGPNAEIPAVRYEVWPPIPGLGRKRGRPPLSHKKRSGATPRSNSSTTMNGHGTNTSVLANGSPVLRRTRSALVESGAEMANGSVDDEPELDDEDKMDVDEATPADEGDEDEVDAEGEEDDDAGDENGDMDVDDEDEDEDEDDDVDAEGEDE